MAETPYLVSHSAAPSKVTSARGCSEPSGGRLPEPRPQETPEHCQRQRQCSTAARDHQAGNAAAAPSRSGPKESSALWRESWVASEGHPLELAFGAKVAPVKVDVNSTPWALAFGHPHARRPKISPEPQTPLLGISSRAADSRAKQTPAAGAQRAAPPTRRGRRKAPAAAATGTTGGPRCGRTAFPQVWRRPERGGETTDPRRPRETIHDPAPLGVGHGELDFQTGNQRSRTSGRPSLCPLRRLCLQVIECSGIRQVMELM